MGVSRGDYMAPMSKRNEDGSRNWFRWVLVGWMIVYSAALCLGWAALQDSRKDSCQATYAGIRLVFEPFQRQSTGSPQQAENWKKFDRRVNFLIHGCKRQINPFK
jgi:hypothetical protein